MKMGAPRQGFLTLTRIGFAARGIMYLLVAWMAVRLGRAEDAGRALAYLGSGRGRILLAAMAAGFAAYGLWRLADAGFDFERRGNDWHKLAIRAGGAGSGVIHLGLAFTAARLALGSGGGGGGSSRKAEAGASMALGLPGGNVVLLIAAAILLGAAGFQVAKAVRRKFLDHLRPDVRDRWWVLAAGCGGYVARGAVFATAAWLLFRAGTDRSAGEAGGLGDALRALPPAVETAVAAGLALFGAFCLIEAWYRILPTRDVKRDVKAAFT
jgi:hypothetical protein